MEADSSSASSSRVFWMPALLERIVSLLPANEVACSMRLVNKFAASLLRSREHTTIHLSQPCPHGDFERHCCAPEAIRSLNLKKRVQLVCLVAASGGIANLEVALEAAGCFPAEPMMEAAAAAAQLEVCRWLHQRGCLWGSALLSAAGAGRKDLCEWMLDSGCPLSDSAAQTARRGGHVGLAEWLLQRRPPGIPSMDMCGLLSSPSSLSSPSLPSSPPRSSPAAAAVGLASPAGCDLVTVTRRLHGREWVEVVGEAQRAAQQLGAAGGCQRGHAEAAAAASATRPTPDWRIKLDCLVQSAQLLADARGRDPLSDLDAAASSGNLSVLQALLLLHPAGDLPESSDHHGSARLTPGFLIPRPCSTHHHGDLLEFSNQHHGNLAVLAAQGGHLHVVAWLVEALGYDVSAADPALFLAAAESGSVQLLAWLAQRNAPVESGGGGASASAAFQQAVEGGCEEALEWMADQGYPLGVPADLYVSAACNGDLHTLRWLLRRLQGAGLGTEVFQKCVRATNGCCPVPALRWLVEAAGCPVDWQAVAEAASGVRGWLGSMAARRTRIRAWIADERQRRQHAAAAAGTATATVPC